VLSIYNYACSEGNSCGEGNFSRHVSSMGLKSICVVLYLSFKDFPDKGIFYFSYFSGCVEAFSMTISSESA
jgi:hypothetical protein